MPTAKTSAGKSKDFSLIYCFPFCNVFRQSEMMLSVWRGQLNCPAYALFSDDDVLLNERVHGLILRLWQNAQLALRR